MKYLNAVGALMLVVAVYFLLSQRPAPPDDPWFQQEVVNSPKLVLVKFGADWCPPCRQLDAVLDRSEGRLDGVKIVRINVDEKPEIASHYGIAAIPHMMLFKEGKVVSTSTGFQNADQLEDWTKRYR
jgi:thioredoxin 1